MEPDYYQILQLRHWKTLRQRGHCVGQTSKNNLCSTRRATWPAVAACGRRFTRTETDPMSRDKHLCYVPLNHLRERGHLSRERVRGRRASANHAAEPLQEGDPYRLFSPWEGNFGEAESANYAEGSRQRMKGASSGTEAPIL
jgi:hypothetical protein